MSVQLELLDHPTRDDLRVFLERLQKSGQPEVRLVVREGLLAVFGCTQAPFSLTDPLPVVLVLRTFALRRTQPEVGVTGANPLIDVVVLGRALLDRIARMGVLGRTLDLPDVTTTVAWAGVLPPIAGWNAVGMITSASLREVAADGIARVADTLPTNPGEAIVRTTRAAVWGLAIAPGVPAAAAFAGETMGFLTTGDTVQVSRSNIWTRLKAEYGEILVRNFAR